jgi:NitT/TauT family transport system substrate-binding protein
MRIHRLLLVAALTLVVGSAVAPATSAAPAQQLTKIAYGADFLISGTAAPIYLAIEKGYFAAGGIEVSVSAGRGSSDAVKRAAAGQADIVQGDIGTAMLLRANEDAQVKVVSPLYGRIPHAIIYYADQNISAPKDLEGKTIADGPGSAPRQLFPAFAGVAGVDLSRVDYRSVDVASRNALMGAAQLEIISAFILNLADVEKFAAQAGHGRALQYMRYTDYGLDMYGNGYIASDKVIAEKPEAIAAFVKGVAMGLRDTYQDIPAAVDAVIRSNPQVDRAVGIRQLELIRDLLFTDDVATAGLGSVNPERMEKTKAVMMRYLGMRQDLPMTDLYTTQFVPASPVLP